MKINQLIRLFHFKRVFNHGFTLIEMLVVVAVIATLIGILLPVLKTVRDNAKRTRALSDIRSLELALQNYYNEYGKWPDTTVTWSIFTGTLNGNRDPYSGVNIANTDNPRGTKFMDFDKTSLGTFSRYIDPWGNSYKILLDNGLQSLDIAAWTDAVASDGMVRDRQNVSIMKPIAIYSFGPNGLDDLALPNYDDVTSWR